MIKANNISKSYGDIKALSNVSLTVEESELFGLIGPDGAGKTTLFRIITTLLLPDQGSVEVMGLDTNIHYKELRKHIGYMPGRFSLYQDLTVEENLSFYATVFGTTIAENYHLIKEIYSHIKPFRKRQAGKLSGGMKQKLALCCALIHAPKLIVLDEPTTGVDAVSRTEFWDMLKGLQKEGITIIVSTPYMDEAMLCDRVALIQKGSILEINKPAGILESFTDDLFAVKGEDKFKLIQSLRDFPAIATVNPFGDSIHITFRENKYDNTIKAQLQESGHKVSIEKKDPSIEDVFLHLMKGPEHD